MELDKWISKLKACLLLDEKELYILCEKAKALFFEESNVQAVQVPVTLCGDIHGQFYDLLELFKTGGDIPETSQLFIGDYVDRGFHSIECFELLLCLKVKYPSKITLLRGNHECRAITQVQGFYDEVVTKYGNSNPWKYCTEVFDFLPISALIEGEIFCVHGGLSPLLKSIDQIIVEINRFEEIPIEGLFMEMMWSDPEEDVETFSSSRAGAGWFFGALPTKQFIKQNNLKLIVRAHQLQMDGQKICFPEKNLYSIFSAPNQCYRCGNQAAIMAINEKIEQKIIIFKESPMTNQTKDFKQNFPYFT